MRPALNAPLRSAPMEAFAPRCAGERRPTAHGVCLLGRFLILLLSVFMLGTSPARAGATAAMGTAVGPFALARTRLAGAMASYANGERQAAADLMLSAYLDGFEPVEPILAVRDNALKVRIEGAIGTLRTGVAKGLPSDDLQGQAAVRDALLARAETVLGRREASAGSSFLGSFTILLREGLEAILIVVAMLAFLRKVDRTNALPYVHGGWIAALLAGLLTWGVGTHLIDISGVSRELAEGSPADELFQAGSREKRLAIGPAILRRGRDTQGRKAFPDGRETFVSGQNAFARGHQGRDGGLHGRNSHK